MDPEELLADQKREFVRLHKELQLLKRTGRSDPEKQDRLRALGKAIVAGNQAQDLNRIKKQGPKHTKYGAPTFKASKKKPAD